MSEHTSMSDIELMRLERRVRALEAKGEPPVVDGPPPVRVTSCCHSRILELETVVRERENQLRLAFDRIEQLEKQLRGPVGV